jgi:hypothetical protein
MGVTDNIISVFLNRTEAGSVGGVGTLGRLRSEEYAGGTTLRDVERIDEFREGVLARDRSRFESSVSLRSDSSRSNRRVRSVASNCVVGAGLGIVGFEGISLFLSAIVSSTSSAGRCCCCCCCCYSVATLLLHVYAKLRFGRCYAEMGVQGSRNGRCSRRRVDELNKEEEEEEEETEGWKSATKRTSRRQRRIVDLVGMVVGVDERIVGDGRGTADAGFATTLLVGAVSQEQRTPGS